MNGTINITDFVSYLKKKDLVIVPKDVLQRYHEFSEKQDYKDRLKRKLCLTFNEISKAGFWGDISAKAVKLYAFKHADPSSIIKVKNGEKEVYKMSTSEVLKLAKLKGVS